MEDGYERTKGRRLDDIAFFARAQLLAPLAGSGRGLFGITALLLLFILGLHWLGKMGQPHCAAPQYVLTADWFEITPQPPWIHTRTSGRPSCAMGVWRICRFWTPI